MTKILWSSWLQGVLITCLLSLLSSSPPGDWLLSVTVERGRATETVCCQDETNVLLAVPASQPGQQVTRAFGLPGRAFHWLEGDSSIYSLFRPCHSAVVYCSHPVLLLLLLLVKEYYYYLSLFNCCWLLVYEMRRNLTGVIRFCVNSASSQSKGVGSVDALPGI